jgi:predicted phage terminase large subunit-like protein
MAAFDSMLRDKGHKLLAAAGMQDFFAFVQMMWSSIIHDDPTWNWHMAYLCREVQAVIERVAKGEKKTCDIAINVPPGTTKSTLTAVMAPAWAWTRWPWMRFICGSYSGDLAQEHGELSKDVVMSERYRALYPWVFIKPSSKGKQHFKVSGGGGRYATSVGGTLTGFHGHVLIIDDPLSPTQAASKAELRHAEQWMTKTLPTRVVDKEKTPVLLIMQRLHQADPTGLFLKWKQEGHRVKHICLPGELPSGGTDQQVSPSRLRAYYKDGLLDPVRLPKSVLEELKIKLGSYGYAGQVQQSPIPEGGAFFDVGQVKVIEPGALRAVPPGQKRQQICYWDKAGTQDGGAYTAGVLIARLEPDAEKRLGVAYLVLDVVRGQWGPGEREKVMRQTAERHGRDVRIWLEQEPGSGGKDSAQASLKNLDGFVARAERATGDKTSRAEPFAGQVNIGRVGILRANWNAEYLDELKYFPASTYKDQVDASSGAYNRLTPTNKGRVGLLIKGKRS